MKKFALCLFLCLFIGNFTTDSTAQTNEEILSDNSYVDEYCDCGISKKTCRSCSSYNNRFGVLYRSVGCLECDLLNVVENYSKTPFPDKPSMEFLRKRLAHLVNAYGDEFNTILSDMLHRSSLSKKYNRDKYEECLISQIVLAKYLDNPAIPKELFDLDCDAYPEILAIGEKDYLVAVPVGKSDHRKPHLIFRVTWVDNGQEFLFQHLPFDWYDPYQQIMVKRNVLGVTQSTFGWDESRKVLSFMSSDPLRGCMGFSNEFTVGEDGLNPLNVWWSYMCSANFPLCSVDIFNRDEGTRGKLIKEKGMCDQPDAEKSWDPYGDIFDGI